MKGVAVFLLLTLTLIPALAGADAAELAPPEEDAARLASPEDRAVEIRQVSPYRAVLSSALMPGLGQIRIGHPVQGAVTIAAVGGVLAGAFAVRASYLDIYNNEYVPLALDDPKSPEAKDAFNRSNQRFKTSQFLFFTALGIWAYSVVDSYVGAHIFNAERKAEALESESFDIDIKSPSEGLQALLSFAF